MPTTGKKFVKAKTASVKLDLGKTKSIRTKEVKITISLPEDVARNLYARLRNRFAGQ